MMPFRKNSTTIMRMTGNTTMRKPEFQQRHLEGADKLRLIQRTQPPFSGGDDKDAEIMLPVTLPHAADDHDEQYEVG